MRTAEVARHPVRRDQLRQEHFHDPYMPRGKPREPAVCVGCGATYHAGRWQWGPRPAGAAELLCAACRRIRDGLPAGFVSVGGDFFVAHRAEILNLIRRHEEKEKADHPLARIIAIEEAPRGISITTTDVHLARDLGESLQNAYHGELKFHYNDSEELLRVRWQR